MKNYSKNDKQKNKNTYLCDPVILLISITLLSIGLVMVASSSISIADRINGQPLYFFYRQLLAAGFGTGIGLVVFLSPMAVWKKYARLLLLSGLILLVLVLIPGIGKEVNGSSRWISFGIFNLQISEIFKLIFIIYLAGYIVKKKQTLTTDFRQLLPPLILLCVASLLLLLEPNLGVVVVIFAIALGMLFFFFSPLLAFVMIIVIAGIALALLIYFEPYRMTRFQAFINPWDDPFKSGFQLTQSLMAFGRGDWLGEGLGKSVQKLFYLPEAHTDFIFAIIAEELGMIGVIVVIVLFLLLIFRILSLAKKSFLSENIFEAYVMFGIGIGISLQAFINIGVNMGVLPTKGLTLPFISYGGSSVMVMCISIALILRAEYETRCSKPLSILKLSLFTLPLLKSSTKKMEGR